jgi:hypothetical protein
VSASASAPEAPVYEAPASEALDSEAPTNPAQVFDVADDNADSATDATATPRATRSSRRRAATTESRSGEVPTPDADAPTADA